MVTEQTQKQFDAIDAGYRVKKDMPPKIKKEIGSTIIILAGYAGLINMVGLALAGVALAAATFLPAAKAAMPAPSVKPAYVLRIEKKAPEYVEAASMVPGSKQIANNLYQVWKGQMVPEALFRCAENLERAETGVAVHNIAQASAALENARLAWKEAVDQLGTSEETQMLANEIINLKQMIVDAQAYDGLCRASAILEVMQSDVLPMPGMPPASSGKEAKYKLELMVLRKFVMQLQDAASKDKQSLNKLFKEVLAQITQLQAALEQVPRR